MGRGGRGRGGWSARPTLLPTIHRAAKARRSPPCLDAFIDTYLAAKFPGPAAAVWRRVIEEGIAAHAPSSPAVALFGSMLAHRVDEGFWTVAGRLRGELAAAAKAGEGEHGRGLSLAAAASAVAAALPPDAAAAAAAALLSDPAPGGLVPAAAVVRAGLAAAVARRAAALAPVAAAFAAAGGAARGALGPRAFKSFCVDVCPTLSTADVAALLDALAGAGDEVTFSAAAAALAAELDKGTDAGGVEVE